MIPGRADADRVQHFDKADIKEVEAMQVRENSERCPTWLRTPVLPQQVAKPSPKLDASMTRCAIALHANLTGEQFELDWTVGDVRDRAIVGFDRTFAHYMEASAFLRGLRAVAERAHHHCPESLLSAPLAVVEHAFGFVVVEFDDEMDPGVEFGSPVARFGTVAECDAFIAGVRASNG